MSRITAPSPRYEPGVAARQDAMTPALALPLLLFCTLARNLRMADAMTGWGGYGERRWRRSTPRLARAWSTLTQCGAAGLLEFAEDAAEAERRGIHDELRQTVGRGLGQILVKAHRASELADSDPVRAEAALRSLADQARRTLADARTVVTVSDSDGMCRSASRRSDVPHHPRFTALRTRRGHPIGRDDAQRGPAHPPVPDARAEPTHGRRHERLGWLRARQRLSLNGATSSASPSSRRSG